VSGLVEHLERFLGPIAAGSSGDETTPDGVQVVWFGPDTPWPGVTTLATLGLHRYHLGNPDRGGLHQELLLHVAMDDKSAGAAGILFQVAGMMVERGNGLQRGQVLGPAGPLFGHGNLTALYVTAPLYLPDESEVFRAAGQTVVIGWLVPITDTEAAYVRAQGWQAFEELLVAQNPDLVDINRPSVVPDATAADGT
jgi:hypothetical protein